LVNIESLINIYHSLLLNYFALVLAFFELLFLTFFELLFLAFFELLFLAFFDGLDFDPPFCAFLDVLRLGALVVDERFLRAPPDVGGPAAIKPAMIYYTILYVLHIPRFSFQSQLSLRLFS
jgi:hypothetical protein